MPRRSQSFHLHIDFITLSKEPGGLAIELVFEGFKLVAHLRFGRNIIGGKRPVKDHGPVHRHHDLEINGGRIVFQLLYDFGGRHAATEEDYCQQDQNPFHGGRLNNLPTYGKGAF